MFWTKLKWMIQSSHQQIFKISSLVKVLPEKILGNSFHDHMRVILLRVKIILLETDSFLLIFPGFSFLNSALTSSIIRSNVQIESQVRHQSLLSFLLLTSLDFLLVCIITPSLFPFDVHFESTHLASIIHSHLRLFEIFNSSTNEIQVQAFGIIKSFTERLVIFWTRG